MSKQSIHHLKQIALAHLTTQRITPKEYLKIMRDYIKVDIECSLIKE